MCEFVCLRMIEELPEELLGHIMLFTDPLWADLLSSTSTYFKKYVKTFYERNTNTLLRPGGEWFHSIKSKRTRDSLQNPRQRISYTCMGVYSILHQKCVGCQNKFMASVHRDFGIIAHAQCIRQYLVNTYYFEKFGLNTGHFETIPQCKLTGYSPGSYGRGFYSYIAVWKDNTNGVVPYEWTAHYVFHHFYRDYTRRYLEEQRQKNLTEQIAKKERAAERKRMLKHIRDRDRDRLHK